MPQQVNEFIEMRLRDEGVVEINVTRTLGKGAVVSTLSDLGDECGYYEVLKETISEDGDVTTDFHELILCDEELGSYEVAKSNYDKVIAG